MIVTIDLNVILDVFLFRGDFDAAMTVLSHCRRGTISGNIPSHATPTIYYILKKSLGSQKARLLSGQILEVLEIIPVDREMLLEAYHSPIVDFEDAIVEVSAKHASSAFLVTSNIKDFKLSRIPAVTPAQLLLRL